MAPRRGIDDFCCPIFSCRESFNGRAWLFSLDLSQLLTSVSMPLLTRMKRQPMAGCMPCSTERGRLDSEEDNRERERLVGYSDAKDLEEGRTRTLDHILLQTTIHGRVSEILRLSLKGCAPREVSSLASRSASVPITLCWMSQLERAIKQGWGGSPL